MGGGDLNSKKSWHPNTMKNQERVWKAEQASAQEQKRILELQRERAAERDRADLNELARRSTGAGADDRLHWMYDKPDKKVQQEDFLLGKAIDSNFEQPDKAKQDCIPVVARRVVGSSMLATAGDTQVDLARKMREDPLMLVKERERAARAALLNNPLQRRRLAELLRKEQKQRSEKKKPKKDKDLDNILAAKLNALGEKQINLATLLASNDSSSDSSSEDEKAKKKLKKSKKHKKEKKKLKHEDSDQESDDESDKRKSKHNSKRDLAPKKNTHKTSKRESSSSPDEERNAKRHRSDREERVNSHKTSKRESNTSPDERNVMRHRSDREQRVDREYRDTRRRTRRDSEEKSWRSGRKSCLSEEERAAKLAGMAAAGCAREQERGQRVARQRAAAVAAEPSAAPPPRARTAHYALPDSLEARIHSNRHYIQRDQRHMNEHFARR